MNWITLILALLTYFLSSKGNSENRSKALLAAAAVGGATYLASNTEWGQANLPGLETVFASEPTTQTVNGVTYAVPAGAVLAKDANGEVILDANGDPTYITRDPSTGLSTLISTTGEVLKSWGGGGTAAVIGATGAVSGAFGDLSKYLPYLLIGAAVLLLSR